MSLPIAIVDAYTRWYERTVLGCTLARWEQGMVAAHLEGGGALMASGAEIGWDLASLGDATDQAFFAEAPAVEPGAVRLRNLAIHTVYGLGLYLSAFAVQWLGSKAGWI